MKNLLFPPVLKEVVSQCLRKDPQERLSIVDIGHLVRDDSFVGVFLIREFEGAPSLEIARVLKKFQ